MHGVKDMQGSKISMGCEDGVDIVKVRSQVDRILILTTLQICLNLRSTITCVHSYTPNCAQEPVLGFEKSPVMLRAGRGGSAHAAWLEVGC